MLPSPWLLLHVGERRLIAEFLTALHSVIPKQFVSSTLIHANVVSNSPDIQSSKMSWWKIDEALAPPCEPTHTCLITVMNATISPSLSATFARILPSEWVAPVGGPRPDRAQGRLVQLMLLVLQECQR